MNRQSYRAWTPCEEEVARELMDAGATDAMFRARLGRSRDAAYSHFKYRSEKPDARKEPRPPVISAGRIIPDSVIQDAKRRNAANQTITATLMGDPRPGQSALDKLEDAT